MLSETLYAGSLRFFTLRYFEKSGGGGGCVMLSLYFSNFAEKWQTEVEQEEVQPILHE